MSSPSSTIHGLMAEFASANDLLAAVKEARKAGYRRMDAYSPFPIEEVCEELDLHHNRLPLLVLAGGITGMLAGFGLAYWSSVIEYPINIGGRPFNSWPAFLPVTFETTVLGASLATVLGMLALNGLPEPYHPVFNVARFALASDDRFFLCIESRDVLYDHDATYRFLQRLGPRQISEVER